MKRRSDNRSCNRNLSNCELSPAEKKIFGASTGFEPVDCVPCVRSAVIYQLSYDMLCGTCGRDKFCRGSLSDFCSRYMLMFVHANAGFDSETTLVRGFQRASIIRINLQKLLGSIASVLPSALQAFCRQ